MSESGHVENSTSCMQMAIDGFNLTKKNKKLELKFYNKKKYSLHMKVSRNCKNMICSTMWFPGIDAVERCLPCQAATDTKQKEILSPTELPTAPWAKL